MTTTYDQTNAASSGTCTTVTDEAGKLRQSCVDGVGRLTGVWEDPGSSPHLNYETDYVYDALNNLTSVTQKGGSTSANWRNRTFTYDSLSHLLNATNPESGSISYAYDADGNLITKTALSPNQVSTGTAKVTTTYAYDALNRLTGKSYSDAYNGNLTPAVSYGYDGANISCPTAIGFYGGSATNGIGRRTAMCYSAGSKSWTYDPMGRVNNESDSFIGLVPPYSADVTTVNGVPTLTELTDYNYYLNGDLSEFYYPRPDAPDALFYLDENAAGQVTSAGDTNFNVFTLATYTPTGQLAHVWDSGDGSSGAMQITNSYNNRLQPVNMSVVSSTSAAILNLTYTFNLGNGDNGNVIQIANGKDNNRTQNFLYDPFNRIWQAYTNGNSPLATSWGETYSPLQYAPGTLFSSSNAGIDPWGNLTQRSAVSGKTNHEALSCPANTRNQLTTCSYQYDPAGNMISNGSINYVYDAENRLIAISGTGATATSYVYDGDGNRVEKCSEGSKAGTCSGTATGMFYWLHTHGGTLAESDLGGNWTAAYGLINGAISDRVDRPSNTVHYYFHDHLGSTSIVTDASGGIENESDYYPSAARS